MRDYLTVLTHNSLVLAKQWQTDGTIKGYDKPKHFAVREAEVTDIEELSALLTELESDKRSCVIRGVLKAGKTDLKKVRRIKANFDDTPHHWIMIEVDKYEPLTADPVIEVEAACLEYIECMLPKEFRGASFHWQLSGSAGHASKAGFLKAHIWFWLSEPRDSLSLRDWAEGAGIECDKAVFDEIQVHYTAAPVIGRDVKDPVPRRSGLWRGERDEVIIDIPISEASGGKDRLAGNWQGAEDEFSLALEEKGKVKGRGRDGSVYIECPWISGHSMKGGDNETVYWPAGTGGYEMGHFDCRHDSCRGRGDGDFIEALGLMDGEFEDLGEMNEEEKQKSNKEKEELKPLERDLKINEDKKSLACIENVTLILNHPELCGKDIRFDVFRDEIVYKDHPADIGWKPFKDTQYTDLRIHLGCTGFLPIGRELMRDAVHYVASSRQIDTAILWLDSLVWDGTERVKHFLSYYMGAKDIPYHDAVSLYMWSALAGRVLDPGCKADAAPIFIGEQYIGKSHAIMTMCPDPRMFAEIKLDDNEDNISRKMRGKLIIEIAELRGLHTKELEGIKAFITRRYEEWVPKYQEFITVYPRRSIFIGTSNKDELFADETGNRRWFPVVVNHANCQAIALDRDQLWAEAKEIFFKEGIQLHYEKANALAQPIREDFSIVDPWEEPVRKWLDAQKGKKYINHASPVFHISTILNEVFSIETRNFKKYDEQRIGKILRKLGKKRLKKRVNNNTIWVWE